MFNVLKATLCLSLVVGALGVAQDASAAKKLLIVTNQPGAAAAKEIKKYILGVAPFGYLDRSEFDIEIKEFDSRSNPIKCKSAVFKYDETTAKAYVVNSGATGEAARRAERSLVKGHTIARIPECDEAALARVSQQFQADLMMYVIDHPVEGGRGQAIPIVTTASPPGVALHEMLHGFGFADEYEYAVEEAVLHCSQRHWKNIAFIPDERGSYRSSDDVRALHGAQIPWIETLKKSAPLVNRSKLGSPKSSDELGLYPSKMCDKIGVKTWKPASGVTVMENYNSTLLPNAYWPTIFQKLEVSQARRTQLMRIKASQGYAEWNAAPCDPNAKPEVGGKVICDRRAQTISPTERPYAP